MNERIKELAEQSGFVIKPFYKGEDNFQTPHFKDEKLERFAELIAQECAELCDRFQARDVGMQPAECAGAIRNMFGVKQ